MPMLDLFWTTLLTGLALLILGVSFILDRPGWRQAVLAFPRSQNAAFITMGIGGLWFLYKMWFLGPEDALFGPKTNLVFVVVFGFAWFGSFFVMKDFLAIRGVCVLFLLIGYTWLQTAFGHYELPSRLFLVSFVYVGVVISIWWGVSPFRARDFLGWLYAAAHRAKLLGGVLAAYGAVLSLVALTY